MEEINYIKGEQKAKLYELKAYTRKITGLLITESVTGKAINYNDLAYYNRKMQEVKSSVE